MRSGAVPVAQRAADAFEDRHRFDRQHRLVHGPVDLGRSPAGKRPALGRRAVAVGVQHVDGQTRLAARGPAWRGRVWHFHPHLGQIPRPVQRELAAASVGGVVHLDHHVGQGGLAHDHVGAVGAVAFRVQVHGLIRLQDAPRSAALVLQPQVRGADGVDGRAPRQRDQRRHLGQALRRVLVVHADAFAHHGRLGGGVPVLDAALVIVYLVAGDVHRAAAGEVGGARHPRRAHAFLGRGRGRT